MNLIVRTTDKCSGTCTYCYVNRGSDMLEEATAERLVDFTNWLYQRERRMNLIWHGGEPMLLGVDFYRDIQHGLPAVRQSFQTNLLDYDESWFNLFHEYNISVGTSIDGPQEIHERHRGRTWEDVMAAFLNLRTHGILPGVITVMSDPNDAETLHEFYKRIRVGSLRIHPATGHISPEDYEEGLKRLFDAWYADRCPYRIDKFTDVLNYLRGRRTEGVCSSTDCLERCLCVGPTGDVSGCNRLTDREFVYGNLHVDDFEEIMYGEARVDMINRVRRNSPRCFLCEFYRACRGGCAHETHVAGNGNGYARDTPYCPRGLFIHIDRRLKEK